MIEKKIKTKIRKGDTVQVITGIQKGIVGKILSINLKEGNAFIEGIQPRIKFISKALKEEDKRKELPYSIHISNLMIWDTSLKKRSRIGIQLINGKKYRYFKKSGNIIP